MVAADKRIPGAAEIDHKLLRVGRWDFHAGLALSTAILGFVAWDQSFWWRTNEEYAFGWLVPFFVAFVVHGRWTAIQGATQDCASGEAGPRPYAVAAVRASVWAVFFGGCVLFSVGALARARSGPSPPGSLIITLGAIALAGSLIVLSAPRSKARHPVRLLAPFGYPFLVWLVSAPLVSALDAPLRLYLMRWVLAAVGAVFALLRLHIERHGNVFYVPGGPVAVEEACIGIRSLTGSVLGSLFLAAAFLDTWPRKLALVAAAFAASLFGNLGRVVFLNLWAYRFGPNAIEGIVHDATGWLVIALIALSLFLLTSRLSRNQSRVVRESLQPGGATLHRRDR